MTRDPRDFAGQEDTLRQKLSGLSAKQRLLIENAFYSHNWTAGSAAVIRLLCEKDLFCLPIYLFNLKDPEEQKNIFNDLLETEHFLLSKVVASSMLGKLLNWTRNNFSHLIIPIFFLLVSGIGHKLKEILAEGIANLLSDLVNDPDLIVPNYLQHLQLNYLNAREMEYLFDLHLTSFLELDSCLSTRDAIAQQSRWEEENPLQRNQCLMLITAETCSKYEKVLGMLIDRMLVPSFVHWKFGLALLKVVLRSAPEMRSVLKSEFIFQFTPFITLIFWYHYRASLDHIRPVDFEAQRVSFPLIDVTWSAIGLLGRIISRKVLHLSNVVQIPTS